MFLDESACLSLIITKISKKIIFPNNKKVHTKNVQLHTSTPAIQFFYLSISLLSLFVVHEKRTEQKKLKLRIQYREAEWTGEMWQYDNNWKYRANVNWIEINA